MSDPTYYETMYILRPDIPEEEVDSHLTKYSDLLVKAEVEVLDSQMRGKRRLAYPIQKHKEGIYVQLSHKGNGQQVAVLEKAMRLSEDVIRYLTVKQEGPLPTPKATSKDEASKKATDNNDKTAVDTKSSSDEKKETVKKEETVEKKETVKKEETVEKEVVVVKEK